MQRGRMGTLSQTFLVFAIHSGLPQIARFVIIVFSESIVSSAF